jgi:hypothetical protein
MHRQGPTPAWEALYQANKSAPTQFKLWTPNWLSGWIPIGKKLKQWKLSTTDVCPRCGEPETHHHHVLRYEQDEAQHQWSASLQSLDRWMTRHHTQRELQIGIIRGLRAWHDHDPLQRPASNWPGVNQTLDEQAELGCI